MLDEVSFLNKAVLEALRVLKPLGHDDLLVIQIGDVGLNLDAKLVTRRDPAPTVDRLIFVLAARFSDTQKDRDLLASFLDRSSQPLNFGACVKPI